MKRLFRNTRNASVAGVCSGLSDYFDIDVIIIRLIFFFGTIFTIFPFLLSYIIMWIVVPGK